MLQRQQIGLICSTALSRAFRSNTVFGFRALCPRLWTTANKCSCRVCIAANSIVHDRGFTTALIRLFKSSTGHHSRNFSAAILSLMPLITNHLQSTKALTATWRTAAAYNSPTVPIVFAHLLRRATLIDLLNDELAAWLDDASPTVVRAMTALVGDVDLLRKAFETLTLIEVTASKALLASPTPACTASLSNLQVALGEMKLCAHQLFEFRASALLFNDSDLHAFYGHTG